MQAIVIEKPGGPEVLKLQTVPDVEPGKGEVRVKVKATAVNRADILQRAGKYPAPADSPSDIPGLEFAGEVDAIGATVNNYSLGDRVFGLVGGGSYAQHVIVNSHVLSRIPDNLSFEEAAAIPEAFITAYDAMITQAKLQPGETVLINGVASGVGTAAVQIARAIGACSIGTSRSKTKINQIKDLGLSDAIVVSSGTFADEVLGITNGAGVDVVLELIGGNYLQEDLRCVAVQGRIILVGLLDGASSALNLGIILTKRLKICGTTLRARPLEEKIAVAKVFNKSVLPLIAKQSLRPVIDKVFPLSRAGEAQTYVESNQSIGKVVLTVS